MNQIIGKKDLDKNKMETVAVLLNIIPHAILIISVPYHTDSDNVELAGSIH